ncbi:MAG: hypothetical protein U5K79_03460 [Cyclobacteriaceae bacterium]|nr:hypothetical protein [Cyclobacteriaceae bacterium]
MNTSNISGKEKKMHVGRIYAVVRLRQLVNLQKTLSRILYRQRQCYGQDLVLVVDDASKKV